MVWMEPRQAVPQPSGRRALESWDGVLKVRPVFRTQIPRLVQELNLRRQVSCAVGCGAQDGFERASNVELTPTKLDNTLAFMFETRLPQQLTRYAAELETLQSDYLECWDGLERKFDGTPGIK